jgi:hypothetical protein
VPETISARIGGRAISAQFDGEVEATPEAAVAAFLLPAMQNAQPLEIDQPVSGAMLDGVSVVQDVYATWWPQYRRVPLLAERANGDRERARATACLFSGGVDSFFSTLTYDEEITHLIYVQGFDTPLTDTALLAKVTAAARQAASELGKELIVIRTDLRDTVAEFLAPNFWANYHGGALAAVGHLLSHLVDTIVVPATHTYLDLFPWGSHPVLDHLWSSDRVRFVHHGADTTRFEKVQEIARSQVALNHLRVCWRNPDGAYNCGRCEKCVRTMIALEVAGVLQDCATMPRTLNMSAVRRMWLQNDNDISYANENLAGARAAANAELARAITYSKARSAAGRALPQQIKPFVKRIARRSGRPGT